MKAGDRVKSGLEAEFAAGKRIFTKAEETARLKQELARATGQLDMLVKEKGHAKLVKLDGLFKTATAAAKKAIEDAAKLGKLKGEAKADAECLAEFLNDRAGGTGSRCLAQDRLPLGKRLRGRKRRRTAARCLARRGGRTRRTTCARRSPLLPRST